ncbi:hypothetical protein [Falsiroseomonas sp.]|uniref:hypothetical protein n=1 Tax=Falsiroseomonas sp. TaxID=2870721 RepID=UPI002720DB9A|nr:hypothetical protein [Falsiroseomonas sp.]MDO9498488.1 hypothetical protein [Falsiroseomonas sp.]
MKMENPAAQQAADACAGVIIHVGGTEPDFLITSKLLASIARPPASETAPAWLELVAAFSRKILSLRTQLNPEAALRPQLLVQAHFEMSKERADALVLEGAQRIEIAMGAAHAQMPALVRGIALSDGQKQAMLPKLWREERALTAESERVMRHEAELTELLQERGEAPPVRFPAIDSVGAPANFRNRVVKPFREVLHLAAGLVQVLDAVERQLAAGQSLTGSGAPLAGFGAYPDRPRLMVQHLLLIPEVAIAAINLARRLEAGLPHLKAQRPKPEEVVRLRWLPPEGAGTQAA